MGARETLAGERVGEGLEQANLYAVAGQLAARAATPPTTLTRSTIVADVLDRRPTAEPTD